MNFAALASIGLVIGLAGGLIAWLVRTSWARPAGMALLIVAVAIEGAAVLGRSGGGASAAGSPSVTPSMPVTSPSSTPSSSPSGGGTPTIPVPSSFHHQLLDVVHFAENTSSGRTQRVLNTEFVLLQNRGSLAVNLSGWTLTAASSGAVYTFQGVTIALNGTIRLHTGTGTNGAGELYWGRTSAVWSTTDTATLKNANGGLEDTCHYVAKADETQASC